MIRNQVRALCAQIAIEIDPEKADGLIEQLTILVLGDYLEKQTRWADGSSRDPSPSKGSA
jgi:hypothetical protein